MIACNNRVEEKLMPRFRSIDSLRGFAALAVVLYHLIGNLRHELSSWVPETVMVIFSYGFLGVPVFFVISGFVIAQSVSGNGLTFRYVGNFVLRRVVRLDPPYWASIAIAMALLTIKNMLQAETEAYPSSFVVLAHLFYVQDFLQLSPVISDVYWTLAMEVQLYLFFILSMLACHKLFADFFIKRFMHLLLMLSLGIFSVLLDHKIVIMDMPGIFLPYWHYFLLGVLVSRVVKGREYAVPVFFVWIVFECFVQSSQDIKPYVIAAVVCTLYIYIAHVMCKLDVWFVNKPLLFLGRISYCLYLLHPDIGWKIISLSKRYFGENMEWYVSLGTLLGSVLVSILAAIVLTKVVEKPSLRLAKRLKLKVQL
jgi:peptidoglycan/LPS O-acetylase OafA/YrhL